MLLALKYSLDHFHHFIGDNGLTEEFPDPIPADPYGKTSKSRKRPADRKQNNPKYNNNNNNNSNNL